MSVDIWNCHPWPLDDSRCRCKIHLVTFLYIFLLLVCFKWDLIHCIEKWRVHSELWQFQLGGGPSAFGVYIFSLCAGMSLFDCFKWVLIDCIVKCRGHSELWQFQLGGVHLPLVSTCFLYALVFPYIFLLLDCFEWALIDCIEKLGDL